MNKKPKIKIRRYSRTQENYDRYVMPIIAESVLYSFVTVFRPKFKKCGMVMPSVLTFDIVGDLIGEYMEKTGEKMGKGTPMFVPLEYRIWYTEGIDFWGIEVDGTVQGYMTFTYPEEISLSKIKGLPKNVFSQVYIREKYRGKGFVFNSAWRIIKDYSRRYGFKKFYSEQPNEEGRRLVKKISEKLHIAVHELKFVTDEVGTVIRVEDTGVIE